MAITFSKSLSETNLLNAYNNNIVEFSSDNATYTSRKCEITIDGLDTPFEITPIDNVFRFNFKEVLSVLINQNNFNDDILPEIDSLDVSTHIYNDTDSTYITPNIEYKITFSNNSTESIDKTYKWLKSVEQLEQNKSGVVTGGNNIYILSPFQKETNNTYNVTYFEGYPFDVSIFLESSGVTTILNQTNALSYDFTLSNTVNRLFFSDGRTTITIDDYLPLVDGLNELKITRDTDVIYLNVTKVPATSGHYVKWLNQYGGWSYWLFNCIHERANKTSSLDDINNDFNDVSDTTTPFYSLGKESVDTLTLISDSVSELDQQVLNGINESPRIYYYTGLRLSQVTDVSWLVVKKTTTSDVITDYKDRLKNYKVKLQLPQRYTMTL